MIAQKSVRISNVLGSSAEWDRGSSLLLINPTPHSNISFPLSFPFGIISFFKNFQMDTAKNARSVLQLGEETLRQPGAPKKAFFSPFSSTLTLFQQTHSYFFVYPHPTLHIHHHEARFRNRTYGQHCCCLLPLYLLFQHRFEDVCC